MVRKLERPAAPDCLSRYRHGRDAWDRLAPGEDCRRQIWGQLEVMQGKFCAYCERSIRQKNNDSHIEHFYQRNSFPRMTFCWNNLFASCSDRKSCGEYKDNQARHISPDLLCKPDEKDPADYLQFLPNGSVQAKPSLTQDKSLIAENTVKAFNLNQSALVNRRRNAARIEKSLAKEVLEVLEKYSDDLSYLQELEDNQSRIVGEDFSAVRKAVWMF